MDLELKQKFLASWKKFFGEAELPITFYYTNETTGAEAVKPSKGWSCFIAHLQPVRKGQALRFDVDAIGCLGGKRYLGFTRSLSPTIHFFLSCGIPGKLEGERYKKTPEIAQQLISSQTEFIAPAKYMVCKRWDLLEEADHPEVAIFFVTPDILSGLFTLANFDRADSNGVFSPFSAGCGAIVKFPYDEKDAPEPRAVIGLFDPSARPYIGPNELTFAVPMNKLTAMINDMEESFLIAPAWTKLSQRLKK